jgi:predicted protein tyrosine phosphatase
MTDSLPRLFSCRLTVCGLSELALYRDQGVSHVLSLLDPGWPDPVVFAEYPPHARAILRFHDVTELASGYQAPDMTDVAAVLDFGRNLAAEPELVSHLLVHCHMGISRSTAALSILLAQSAPGHEREALARVQAIRPRGWPNSRMIRFADALLGRDGALVTALKEHQRAVIAAYPELAPLIAGVGRADELPD